MTRLKTGCRQSEEVAGESRERFEFEIQEDFEIEIASFILFIADYVVV